MNSRVLKGLTLKYIVFLDLFQEFCLSSKCLKSNTEQHISLGGPGFKFTTQLHFFSAWFAKYKSLFWDVQCLPFHTLNASKQEPLELFCFILAVVCVSFVFLVPLPHSFFSTSERVCECVSLWHSDSHGREEEQWCARCRWQHTFFHSLNRHKKQLRDQGLSVECAGEE